jgi:hypothetical protein
MYRFSDGDHDTTGKGPCSDNFHPGHQPRSVYHLWKSTDRKFCYPGLPDRLAEYSITKRLSVTDASLLPDEDAIRDMVSRGVPFAKAYSKARKALPLARVLDSELKNAVHRFLEKAKEQGKHAFLARRWVEPVVDEVHVIEVILAEPGIDWGRMKGIEVLSEGDKRAIIEHYTDPEGLGLGGCREAKNGRRSWLRPL